MADFDKIQLPSSGLAEDILAQFIDRAQSEVDQVRTAEQKEQAHIPDCDIGQRYDHATARTHQR